MKQRNSKMVTFRASERTRYALRLIEATRALPSTSEAIHFAIEETLRNPEVGVYDSARDEVIPLERVVQMTWDQDEAVRFLRLRARFPALLAARERLLQRVVESIELDTGKGLSDDEIRARWPELTAAAEKLA